ncbi:glycosyltransferase family protein [Dinghuibacter silviterrae]|uniref:Glycosyltransferase involved in cell wall biosynthesis n=1 Tax=Dinghuibacter silviterrae TaxID=1539049 RepID=A0A4V3GLM0_9BACT|nr:glycosyltransferase family 4 protein [Dinghuibacter silviterrae]TDX00063.1 hypothetical protein EDB95_1079 [Dinghuibacter silviterrae]
MRNLGKEDIIRVYDHFKKSAHASFESGDHDKAIEWVSACSRIAYHSNFFYTDPELDGLLRDIAQVVCGGDIRVEADTPGDRLVFIDTDGSDNHGLTQQYIRALIAAGAEFAYVYEDADLGRIKTILGEIRDYPKATVITFEKGNSDIHKTRAIADFIREYRPRKYIMHILPWDAVAVMVCNLLKGVDRYNINATDHAFWLGASCIDYCIEFRDYGYTVSLEQRGLKKSQLLMLPYYPISNGAAFKGFPARIPEDAVKVFSGGSFYKIYGEKGLYFDMVRRLLSENPQAVVLYAGAGNGSKLKRYIKENGLVDRVILLGNRGDIDGVFQTCDFYLGTYPICGGLMSQYAAVSGKAILAYTDPKLGINMIEGLVCHQDQAHITDTSLEGFYARGKRLCDDETYRREEGDHLKRCVIPPLVFNDELRYLLENNVSKRVGRKEYVDYEAFSDLHLEVENHYQPNIQMYVALRLRWKTALKFPKIFVNAMTIKMSRILKIK